MKHLTQTLQAAFAFGLGKSPRSYTALKTTGSLIPSEHRDNVILDSVGLATTNCVNEHNTKMFETLRGDNFDVKAVENSGKTDYKVKTANNSYELTTLKQIDQIGLHAKSYVVHHQDDSKAGKSADSLRIAFGGTRNQDWGRTFAMHVTKLPLHYEKNLREFIEKTLDAYQEAYPNVDLPSNIIFSGHSAGATQANKAYEIMKEKGLSSQVHLHLYEPFGAKFSKLKNADQENVVSYRSHDSFLENFPMDGETVGRKIFLPQTDVQKKILDGQKLTAVQNGVLAASFGAAINSAIEGNRIHSILAAGVEDKGVVCEDQMCKSQSTNGLSNFAKQIQNSIPRGFSTGGLARI